MKKTKLDALKEKSLKAMGMFNFAINSLKTTNDEIDNEIAVNEETISIIETTNTSLHNLKSQNTRILSNLENLLK